MVTEWDARAALKDDNFTLAASIFRELGKDAAADLCIKSLADIKAEEARDAADPIYQRFAMPRARRNSR